MWRDATHAGDDSSFDPSTVPLYPLLRTEIRKTDDGGYEGLLEDQLVAEGEEMEEVRGAVIERVAGQARRRLGAVQAVRVRGRAADGGLFAMVVTGEGEVYQTSQPATSETTGATASPKAKGRKKRVPTPDPEQRRRFKVHPLMLVIVGFPVLLVSFFVWMLFVGGDEPHAPAQPPGRQQLPVVAPKGYSPVARWAVKVGQASAGTTEGVAADADHVYAATGSADEVTAYAAGNGLERWSVDLGASLTAGPSVTTVNGQRVVVAATSAKLVVLDRATGEELGSWKLDESGSTQVRITATGPVLLGPSNSAQIIVGDALRTRIMPAGALPVGPGPGGSLIAATRDRIYASTSASVSGVGAPIEPAGKGSVTVAGWTGQQLVLAYETAALTGTEVALAGYAAPPQAAGPWTPRWKTEPLSNTTAATIADDTELPLVSGPAGRWGLYGSTVVSLEDGTTTPLPDWTTSTVGNDIAFGTGTSRVLSAGPQGLGGRSDPQPSDLEVVAPQAVSGSAAYLVTSGGGTDAWLYALVPDGSADQPVAAPATEESGEEATPRPSAEPRDSSGAPKRGARR